MSRRCAIRIKRSIFRSLVGFFVLKFYDTGNRETDRCSGRREFMRGRGKVKQSKKTKLLTVYLLINRIEFNNRISACVRWVRERVRETQRRFLRAAYWTQPAGGVRVRQKSTKKGRVKNGDGIKLGGVARVTFWAAGRPAVGGVAKHRGATRTPSSGPGSEPPPPPNVFVTSLTARKRTVRALRVPACIRIRLTLIRGYETLFETFIFVVLSCARL